MAPKLSGPKKEWINWSKREPKEAGAKVFEMVQKCERNLGWRHTMAMRGAMAYSGAGLGDLFENMQFDAPWSASNKKRRAKNRFAGFGNREEEQHARAIIETVVEKLFGLDEPKTQLVATDAEWEIRRQGIWADRFIDGNMHLSQGSYLDFWDLARQGALLSLASTGTAGVRTEPDYVTKRVRNRLRSTLQTYIDPADMANDVPLTCVDVTWENPEYLCEDERFKGKEDLIWKAARIPAHLTQGGYGDATFGTPMVKLVTAWRKPFGSFKGRQAYFASGDSSCEPLFWDDWKHPEWPIAIFRANRCLGDSFWGENMIEVALNPLRDAEDIDDIVRRTMERTSQTYLALDGDQVAPAAIANAKDVMITRYSSKRGERPPEVLKPGLLHADYFAHRDRKIQIAHDLTGVSLMHQAGEVQGASGDRSGRSIRLEASLMPERFARKLRAWRNWVAVDCAKNIIRAAQEIGKVDPDWQVTWPGADFDAKVKVDVLDIDIATYTIQPYAVSEQKNTPQDRADAAREMVDRGEITEAQYVVIVEGLYDTKKETKAATAERRYVASVTDQILHGDPKLIADENRYMAEEYIPPLPWFDPDSMIAQAAPIMTNALIDKVPQNRRSLLRRFLEDIWALRMQKQREEALANASVNVAAQTATDPFAAAGGAPPNGQPQLPAPPGSSPPGGAPMPPGIGAPPAMPPGVPLNAPGPAGVV
jgi:hypothetical protein